MLAKITEGKETSNCCKDSFKVKLDKWLKNIPEWNEKKRNKLHYGYAGIGLFKIDVRIPHRI